jgi:ubiquinone/menaquinone biosynthesis C-methylase UbiE
MERIVEEEIMGGQDQALAYARADFTASNIWFVDRLVEERSEYLKDILDIGCGPGDLDIRLAKARPSAHITAVDGSGAMLDLANEALKDTGQGERINFVEGYIPGVDLQGKKFDMIFSKDFLHHLHNPMGFWDEVKHFSKETSAFWLMDLYRPKTTEEAEKIVETVCVAELEVLKVDFYNSLLAAFTVDEIKEQACEAGIKMDIEIINERHFIANGLVKSE